MRGSTTANCPATAMVGVDINRTRLRRSLHKGEPVCRPDPPSRRFPPAVLHVGIYEITRLCVSTTIPLLDSSLFCCPSIFAQALRAAIVAAELPLRGKLLAEATIFSTDPFFLEVVYQCLQTLLVQGLILCWQPRIAPCSTRGQNWRGRPCLFCWVRVSDLESGGARCARRP